MAYTIMHSEIFDSIYARVHSPVYFPTSRADI